MRSQRPDAATDEDYVAPLDGEKLRRKGTRANTLPAQRRDSAESLGEDSLDSSVLRQRRRVSTLPTASVLSIDDSVMNGCYDSEASQGPQGLLWAEELLGFELYYGAESYLQILTGRASLSLGSPSSSAPASTTNTSVPGGALLMPPVYQSEAAGSVLSQPSMTSSAGGHAKVSSVETADALQSDLKLVLLYFSGRWCPLCAHLDMLLYQLYADLKTMKEAHDIEAVCVSCDASEVAYNEHLGTLGLLAVAWDRSLIDDIMSAYDVEDLPVLLVLDAQDGTVLSRTGRSDVLEIMGKEHEMESEDDFGGAGRKRTSAGLLGRWLTLRSSYRKAEAESEELSQQQPVVTRATARRPTATRRASGEEDLPTGRRSATRKPSTIRRASYDEDVSLPVIRRTTTRRPTANRKATDDEDTGTQVARRTTTRRPTFRKNSGGGGGD